MTTTTRRRPCHWSMPNKLPMSQWAAADNLHAMAGDFAEPYDQFLEDGGWTTDEKPKRDYELRRLGQVGAIRAELDRAEQQAVDGLRSLGVSWADIGQALGVTRQAAQMRFGK